MKHIALVFPAENGLEQRNICFSGKNVSDGYLTIYIGKPEIPVVKSNVSRHSVWDASENMSCDLRPAALDAVQSVFFTFQSCLADLDILCSGSFDLPHPVKFYSFVFINKILCG